MNDGIEIGKTYWNNNLERCVVLSVSHVEEGMIRGVPTGHRVTWYVTTRGLFDASRLVKVHPGTGERA